MKMFTYTCVLVFLLLCSLAYAQQEVNYNLYRYHLNLLNPAVTGTQQEVFLNMSVRTQWVGIKDAPETQAFSMATSNAEDRFGAGFSIINDKTFVENQTQFFADFSYHLPMEKGRNMYLGLKAGGTSLRLNANRLKTYGTDLPDQYLQTQSSFVPNVGVGIYYKTFRYYLSASVPRLLNTERYRFDDGQVSQATDRPHYFISSGYRFTINEDWDFTPNFLYSYVSAAPADFTIDTCFTYDDRWDFSLQYTRSGGIGMTSVLKTVTGFQLGYAYVTSSVDRPNRFSKGTHELVMKIPLKEIYTLGERRNSTFINPVKEKKRENENKKGSKNKENTSKIKQNK